MATLICAVLLFFAMSRVTTPFQLGLLRFLLGFADGAMLPAVQTLLVKYSSDQITGRIFGYNQSFMYTGNVVGPLMGATVSAMAGFRWVFIATAAIVLINIGQLTRRYVVGVTRKSERPIAVHRNGASAVTIWFKLKDIFFIREVFL